MENLLNAINGVVTVYICAYNSISAMFMEKEETKRTFFISMTYRICSWNMAIM